jgi:SAM-dependent methyltransferase
MERYELFGTFAARYDLHTPPDHDLPDHELVLGELSRLGRGARILDLGCGTGVFLQRAREAGFSVSGIDISPEMVAIAEQRLGPGVVRVQRLQDVEEREAFDALVSLSLPFNYCAGVSEARQALAGFHQALRPGGLLLLQAIHAANVPDRLLEEWGEGPGGEKDVQFLCRFVSEPDGGEPAVRVQYVYSCRSLNELLYEEHVLRVADAQLIAELLRETGFSGVRINGDSGPGLPVHAAAPIISGYRPPQP